RIETRPAVLEGTPASDSAKRPSIDADLDAIALKALRKEPEERYASAEAFARDLERSLDGEPVAARAGSTAYRLRRFIRRHRTAAAVTVAFIGLLIAWGASALVQAQRVVEQRDAARLQAEKAENINDFVLDLFETSDPAIARGEIPDARELLARGAERVDRELSDQPALRVSLKVTLGRVYRNLGLHEEAEALLSGALEDIEQLPDDEREDELDLHILLADVALHRVDVERADEMLRRTVALSIERHGARSPEAAMAHGRQGKGFLRTGRSAEAEAAFLRSAELLEELEPEPSENWAEHYRLRGEAILQQDRTEEGLAHLRRADEIYQRLDGDRAEPRAEVLELIGNTILKEGDVAAARTTLQEALALARQLSVAKPHLELGSTLASLGTLEAAHGDPQTAESLLRESAGAVATVWGERHPKHGMALLKLARFHAGHGDPEAEAGFRRSLDILSQRLPDDHPHMAAIRYRLADFLLAQGRAAEAETLARRVAEIRSQNYGSDDKRTGDAIRLAERAAAQAASQPPNLNRSTP
ncbi:MAG: tetratricopeptide repeat protein, partial [Acidobacteriota bacterium]